MTDQECIDGTLAWCNKKRKEKGMEPLDQLPKGRRYRPTSCPCGEATGLSVGAISYGWFGEDRSYNRLPDTVKDFVNRFDAGQLPQFDITL